MQDVTTLYCILDDFVKDYKKNKLLISPDNVKKRNRKSKLSESEVMTILILFHTEGYRNLKTFYLSFISRFYKKYFPNLVSYNRFVELQRNVMELLMMFMISIMGTCTGISFIDSTKIAVCSSKRSFSNKVFKTSAAKGKSSMGWFFGFKLHLVINEIGEILSVKITKGNCSDTKPVLNLSKKLYGTLFGDKGYISKKLSESLLKNGITLITGIRKNMKNKLVTMTDKILLRKRSIIETVNDQLKNISQVEHTRHRSLNNFMINIISGLIAYSLKDKKPTIKINETGELAKI